METFRKMDEGTNMQESECSELIDVVLNNTSSNLEDLVSGESQDYINGAKVGYALRAQDVARAIREYYKNKK